MDSISYLQTLSSLEIANQQEDEVWAQSQADASPSPETGRKNAGLAGRLVTFEETGDKQFLQVSSDPSSVRYIDQDQAPWQGFRSGTRSYTCVGPMTANVDQMLIDQEYRYIADDQRVEQKITRQNQLAECQQEPDSHGRRRFRRHIETYACSGELPPAEPDIGRIECVEQGATGAAYTLGIKDQDGWTTGTFQHLEQDFSYTMVFDGHNSQAFRTTPCACVEFLKAHLARNIHHQLSQYAPKAITSKAIWNSLKTGCVRTDFLFPSEESSDFSGATANLVLFHRQTLWCANLGDCGAILVAPDGSWRSISYSARAADPLLQRSIGKRCPEPTPVINNRLLGGLEPARCFGDHHYGMRVSSRPKVTRINQPAQGWQGYWLVQASDGLWDTASSYHVARLVGLSVDKGLNSQTIARDIVETAVQTCQRDDITALVTPLKDIFSVQ